MNLQPADYKAAALPIELCQHNRTRIELATLCFFLFPACTRLFACPDIFIWRRGWDSNPRCVAASPVFKTGSLNHSDTSPYYDAATPEEFRIPLALSRRGACSLKADWNMSDMPLTFQRAPASFSCSELPAGFLLAFTGQASERLFIDITRRQPQASANAHQAKTVTSSCYLIFSSVSGTPGLDKDSHHLPTVLSVSQFC